MIQTITEPISEVCLEDCKVFLNRFPDKYFDLGVIDPPYGIGEDGKSNHSRGKLCRPTKYTAKNWDNEAPDEEYFDLLNRKCKNLIIWGANHFIDKLPFSVSSPCWIVWDKVNGQTDFADCELAWTSFPTAVRKFSYMWNGMLQGKSIKEGHLMQGNKTLNEKRIHPTQKPVALYDWTYKNYLPNGGKVCDTHLGSGSNRISAYKAGNIDFYACDNDPEYIEKQEKRFQDFKSQLRLF